jgi:hypothetical protein
MERIIEFPKPKASEEQAESASPVRTVKIFNIADWTPRSAPYISPVDSWPFCAA